MTKQKWEVKHHTEKPFSGHGDYDEYFEITNERGDALQALYDFDSFQKIADALNAHDGEIRITTALEINQHCENMELKGEIERLKAENEKTKKSLTKIEGMARRFGNGESDPENDIQVIEKIATEALKTT